MTSVVMEMFSREMMQLVSKKGIINPPLPLSTRFFRPVITIALSAGTLRQQLSRSSSRIATTIRIHTYLNSSSIAVSSSVFREGARAALLR